MRLGRLTRAFFAVCAALAVASVPLHVAAEHGHGDAEHEGPEHVASDHDVVVALKPVLPPLDLRPAGAPAYLALTAEPEALSAVRRAAEPDESPPPRDRTALPPTPPRAPPAPRA